MKRSNKISSLRSAFVVFGFAVVTPLQAEISYSFNGFGTIAVGKYYLVMWQKLIT